MPDGSVDLWKSASQENSKTDFHASWSVFCQVKLTFCMWICLCGYIMDFFLWPAKNVLTKPT